MSATLKDTHTRTSLTHFRVARNGNVDKLHRRVGVAKGDDGNVDACRLRDRLVISSRVGNHEKARLFKSLLNLIGEGTWKR